MKWVPFPVIASAKEHDTEAIEFICRHFEGYIVYRSLRKYSDLYGNEKSFLDDERYSEAQTAMLFAIFSFDFLEPPEDYRAG